MTSPRPALIPTPCPRRPSTCVLAPDVSIAEAHHLAATLTRFDFMARINQALASQMKISAFRLIAASTPNPYAAKVPRCFIEERTAFLMAQGPSPAAVDLVAMAAQADVQAIKAGEHETRWLLSLLRCAEGGAWDDERHPEVGRFIAAAKRVGGA